MSDATAQQVVERLRDVGLDAHFEYPGFIGIPAGEDRSFAFGTANPTWTGELLTDAGDVEQAFDLAIPSTSDDVDAIVTAIGDALQAAHEDEDPHCTCPDCIVSHERRLQ